MAEVKKFDADAKFGDVKKYQEDIEVLLKGIDNEVCVLVHQLTFIMSQAYGTRAPCVPMCTRVAGACGTTHASSAPSLKNLFLCFLRIKQQKQLKDYVKGEPGPHGDVHTD